MQTPSLSFPRENTALIPYMPAGQTYPLRFPYEMTQSYLPVQSPGQLCWAYPAQQVFYYCEQPAPPLVRLRSGLSHSPMLTWQPVYYWNGQFITYP